MIAWSKKFSPEALLSHFCQKNQFDNIRHRETIGIHVDPLAEMGKDFPNRFLFSFNFSFKTRNDLLINHYNIP